MPPQSPALIASILTMTPSELDAWMETALVYPGTPLRLDRDQIAWGALLDLAEEAPETREVLRAACGRCVEQCCAGRVMDLEVFDDLLILALEWRIESLVPTLMKVIQAPPKHPIKLRQRMVMLLAEVGDLPVDFWLETLTCEAGALAGAAFRGLFKLDRELAISKLSALPKGVRGVWIVLEQHFEDHPEHLDLLPRIREQLPMCTPELRADLTEWLAEM